MKIIQKILLSTLLLTVAVVALQAQKGQQRQHDPEKRAEHMTQRMTETLGLSDQQAAQVKAIHLKYTKQMAEKRQQAGEGQRPDREVMKAMREAQMSEIKPLLTAEQLTKLEAKRAEKGGKGQRGAGRDIDPAERAKHATERMAETLKLTDEQARKVETIHLDFGIKKQELLQQHQNDHKAAKGEMKKLRDEKKTALKSVLTEAQFKQWNEEKPKHNGKRKGGLKQSNDERM